MAEKDRIRTYGGISIMNNNVHENFAERVHVNQQEFFSERAYYDSGAKTVWKKLSFAGS